MQSPPISVLTTVYNGMPYLSDAVKSVLRQTFRDFDYVIVDDGSGDGTREWLAQIQDPRVRAILMARFGRGFALNAGLKACRGDYVAILDADDVCSPVRLQAQYAFFLKHPELSALSSACCLDISDLAVNDLGEASFRFVAPREFIGRTPLHHSAVMLRRDAAIAVGGYDATRRDLFDYDLWLRLASAGHRLGKISFPLVYKRLHQGQVFERRHRLRYLVSGFRLRMKAFRLFSENFFDIVYPAAGFLFGLLPLGFRRKLFGLSCK